MGTAINSGLSYFRQLIGYNNPKLTFVDASPYKRVPFSPSSSLKNNDLGINTLDIINISSEYKLQNWVNHADPSEKANRREAQVSTRYVSPRNADEDSRGVNTQNKTLSKQNHLGTLKPEILERIASRLNKSELLLFRKVCKKASEIGHYIDHEIKALIFFKKKESIKTQIPNDITSLILIHTPNSADAKKIFGSIPRHITSLRLTTLPSADDAPGVLGVIPEHLRSLGLTTLPSADDAPGVLGAIPEHIRSLRLTTLPSAADAQTYKNAIPLGIVHNIP